MKKSTFLLKEFENAVKRNNTNYVLKLFNAGFYPKFRKCKNIFYSESVGFAVWNDNRVIFREMLKRGLSPDMNGLFEHTIVSENFEMMVMLIDNGAYVTGIWGWKAIKEIIECYFDGAVNDSELVGFLKKLFNAGADVVYSYYDNETGSGLFSRKLADIPQEAKELFVNHIRRKLFRYFDMGRESRAGLRPKRNNRGLGEYMAALAYLGDSVILGNILNAGVCPDLRNSRGETALIVACTKKNKEIMRLLLNAGAGIYKADIAGNRPIDIVSQCPQDIQEVFIKCG